jgi:NAD(P)-dependent dehydrogenase (short-subunit alcohol dehydrogenase family)
VALPIVVTGGSAGIGRAVAAALVAAGHPVIIASRHPERARLPGARLMPLDLTDRASIEGLAATVRAEDLKLAAVIANAGVWPTRRIVTRAGHELGLAVAHVGHAALIDRLAPALDDGARVVVVASGLHARGRIAWDDLAAARGFDPMAAYAQAKLANVMYALALARRRPSWRVNAVHPGIVRTALHGERVPPRAIAPRSPPAPSSPWRSIRGTPRPPAATSIRRPRAGPRPTPSIAPRRIGCGRSPRR